MAPAQTLAEREALRQRLRERAVADALNHHVTSLCRGQMQRGTPDADHGCRGEFRCLCTCHDGPADGDQKPPAP